MIFPIPFFDFNDRLVGVGRCAWYQTWDDVQRQDKGHDVSLLRLGLILPISTPVCIMDRGVRSS